MSALAVRAALAQTDAEIAAGTMPIAGDRLLHLTIAGAADNGPLLRTVTEHRAVVKALAARDPDAARAAMQRHLKRPHDRFAVNWPQDGGQPET